jgi:hypothetical protein
VGFASGHAFKRAAGADDVGAPLCAELLNRGFADSVSALSMKRECESSLKMNFIFKMPDAILTFHVAEAHR